MTLTVIDTASKSLKTSLSKIQISSKLRSLDLEPIKFKLIKECGWTLEKADKIEPLYKGFLLINALHPQETHVPTQDIDDMWHAHILDTQKYMNE